MNILMTGCAKGFGKSVRKFLEEQGHKVFGVGNDGPDLKVDFNLSPGMFNSTAVGIVQDAFDSLGGFQCLINNAGMTHAGFIPNHTVEAFQRVMNVNVFMPFALIEACVSLYDNLGWESFSEQSPFRVINTGSMSIKLGLRSASAYAASKAALYSITRTLAKESAGKRPLLSIMVSPGAVADTDMTRNAIQSLVSQRGMTDEEARAYFHSASPLGRSATHEEVFAAFSYAVNSSPMYASGSNIELPGANGNF